MFNNRRLALIVATPLVAAGALATFAGTASAAPQSEMGSAQLCPSVYGPVNGFTTSSRGNDHTSCAFAENVRVAYAMSGPRSTQPREIQAYSPVTKQTYTMTCQMVPGEGFVVCKGGNDAVVYIS